VIAETRSPKMIPSQAIDLSGTAEWARTTDLLIHSQKHLHQSNQSLPVRVRGKALRRTAVEIKIRLRQLRAATSALEVPK
jgi:hypothetical protein